MSCLSLEVVKLVYRTPRFITEFPVVWCDSRAVDSYSGQNYEHRRGWVEQKRYFAAHKLNKPENLLPKGITASANPVNVDYSRQITSNDLFSL